MRKILSYVVAIALLYGTASAAPLLVYDSGDYSLSGALTNLGYAYDLRSAANPVTAADLASHGALIVGWAQYDTSGLNAATLAQGITGNILLTGHDADYHSYYVSNTNAATFLKNAVNWAQAGGGTGLIALGGSDYSFLPASYGISAVSFGTELITDITAAGTSSGVFTGLTPNDLSYWGTSSHTIFTGYGNMFTPFELSGTDIITLGAAATPTVPEPSTWLLLGVGVAAVVLKRKNPAA